MATCAWNYLSQKADTFGALSACNFNGVDAAGTCAGDSVSGPGKGPVYKLWNYKYGHETSSAGNVTDANTCYTTCMTSTSPENLGAFYTLGTEQNCACIPKDSTKPRYLVSSNANGVLLTSEWMPHKDGVFASDAKSGQAYKPMFSGPVPPPQKK